MRTAFLNRRAILAGSTLVLLLLLIVACVRVLRFERETRAPEALAARTARSSAKMRQLLGEPMRVSRFARGTILSNGGDGNADLTIKIRGPLGRGTLFEWAQEGSGRWQICSLLFRSADGSISIPLVDDSFTHCERE
jgi:hypothetical protein